MSQETVHTNIRIPKSQANEISKICEHYGITQSQFIRICIDNYLSDDPNKILSKDNKFKKELLYHLLKIGNNINQIAYNFNYIKAHNYIDQSEATLNKAKVALNNCAAQLSDIKKHIIKRL